MWKRWLTIGVGILLIIAIGFGIFTGMNLNNRRKKEASKSIVTNRKDVSPTPTSEVPTTSESVKEWARTMALMYPHKLDSYSGVILATLNPEEVWVIGRLAPIPIISPIKYLGIENSFGNFAAKLSDLIRYTVQEGDDLLAGRQVTATDSGSIKNGDFVAVRMTFKDNFGLALEVRRLIRDK